MKIPGAIRNVGGLSISALIGIMLTLASAPILSRIYTPAELGFFSSITGLATLLATASTLALPSAIAVWADPQESRTLVWMSLTVVAVTVPVATILLSTLWPSTLGVSAAWTDWLLVCLVALLTGIWMSLRAFAVRESLFTTVAVGGASDTAGQITSQIGFGLSGASTAGLAGGYAFGKVVVIGILVRPTLSLLGSPLQRWIPWPKWRSFVLLLMPTLLLNQASVSAIGPTITSLLGKDYGGYFALATRVLSVPASLIGQAIATVMLPSLVRLEGDGSSSATLVRNVATFLSAVAAPMFLVPLLLGPELFAFIFGDPWLEAGVVASLLSPWLALNLISSTISSVGTVHRRLGTLFLFGILEASARIGGLVFGEWLGGPRLSIGLYSLAGCLISLIAVGWFLRLSGSSAREWIRSIPRLTCATIAFAFVGLVAKPYTPDLAFLLAVTIVSLLGLWLAVRHTVAALLAT